MTRAEERRLVQAARHGDRRALSRLLTLLAKPVYRFGRGFCGDPDDAEDVTQTVLMALTRTLQSFRGDSSLTTWAYTVARHACARHRRRRVGAPARLHSLEEGSLEQGPLAVQDPAQDPHLALERLELSEALQRAITTLPPAQREVLVLRDVEGLSAREVGEVLRLRERAVKSRLHRARVTLREMLAPWAAGLVPPGASPQQGAPARRCPNTARLISRHLEGELSAEACDELQRHVATCPACGAACETLRLALGTCRAWRGRTMPASVQTSVRSALRALVEERAPRPSGRSA